MRAYGQIRERVTLLAGALASRLGVEPGDPVASYAWNTADHLELYLGVPSYGAVLHTVNIRLEAQQTAQIITSGGSRVMFVDATLLERVGEFAGQLDGVQHVVIMGSPSAIPEALHRFDLHRYDELLADAGREVQWPPLADTTPCTICFTSGTTGQPRGVVYSHRGMVLHAWMLNQQSVYGFDTTDVIMPIVPFFHANGWGLPYAGMLAGCDFVLPGEASADPGVLLGLVQDHGVTFAAGVPTVWLRVLEEQASRPRDLSSLRACVSGGAPTPRTLAERFLCDLGIELWQGWGMTETGPLASLAKVPDALRSASLSERARSLSSQGRAVPGMRLRLRDPQGGQLVLWEPGARGELLARGPWTAVGYLDGDPAEDRFVDGWVRTGDLARIDEHGSLHIVDRLKDLVKSGGEWIPSIELEAALNDCSGVREAAVVAAPDEQWGERPVAFVVTSPSTSAGSGSGPTADEIRAQLSDAVPRWWLPERIVFIAAIPKTGVGKYDKRALRASLGLDTADNAYLGST